MEEKSDDYKRGYLDGIKEAESKFKWINAKEKPKKNVTALVKLDDGSYDLGIFLQGEWRNRRYKLFEPYEVLKYFIFPD